MQVLLDPSPAEWLSHVEPLLLQAEAENNLLLGLAAQAVSDPARFGQGLTLARTVEGSTVVGAAMVNQYNLVLSRQSDEALRRLAQQFAELSIVIPGALGPDEVPERFVGHWTALKGANAKLRQSQRIYECRRVKPLTVAPGRLRTPENGEIPTLAEWRRDFHVSANLLLVEDDHAFAVQRMIEHGQVFVWDDSGEIVSCAAIGRRTPRGAAVTMVYTPPEVRSRGYATSCVAELTRARLAAGDKFCCLYTDLANPISNAIYARIGYRRVCDSAWWTVPSATTV